jgi:hypothetical protein
MYSLFEAEPLAGHHVNPSAKASRIVDGEIQKRKKRQGYVQLCLVSTRYLLSSMYSLFDLLPGELTEIVDYAFDIYKKQKRAPIIAVNASSWWNINLTTAAVQAIRDSESSNRKGET